MTKETDKNINKIKRNLIDIIKEDREILFLDNGSESREL